eukprot:4766186-Amphidinium_carterae.1
MATLHPLLKVHTSLLTFPRKAVMTPSKVVQAFLHQGSLPHQLVQEMCFSWGPKLKAQDLKLMEMRYVGFGSECKVRLLTISLSSLFYMLLGLFAAAELVA